MQNINKGSLENQKDLIKNIFPQGIPINKKSRFEHLLYLLSIKLLKYQKHLKFNWWDKGGEGRKTLHLAILKDPDQFRKTYRNLRKLIV